MSEPDDMEKAPAGPVVRFCLRCGTEADLEPRGGVAIVCWVCDACFRAMMRRLCGQGE